MARMDDAELLAITGNEIRQSIGYRTGRLSEARRKNLQYYLGRAVGDLAPPEIEGRSAVVDSSVHDTVEWMMPSLVKTFTAGDSVVEFAPQRQDDEEAAKQATDYVNYIFYRQNPGFQILSTWFKDALLSKAGILKVMWDETTTESREEFDGMSDEELAMLAEDKEVQIIEHTARPDEQDVKHRQEALQQLSQQYQQAMMQNPQAAQQIAAQIEQINAAPAKLLHDVACKRTRQNKQVRVFNVPPEEFLLNRDATSIEKSRFCAHQVLRTISDLRAMGYKNVDELTSDDVQASLSVERVERITFNDETGWQSGANEVPGDPSQKQIWVTECYMRVDADGDGIAEWRKLTRAGNRLLDNEECDGPPFVAITPVPLPHQFFGLCPADQALEIQKQKTAVMRAVLDNLYLSVNGRYFAVDGQVNLDDLLTSRPGGVVRMKQAGMAGRLDQGMGDATGSYQLLDYLELQKEQRTGLMRNTQGVNADAMNQTATGANIRTAREDSRLELIARQFAETGVKDLFRIILKLVSQHQDKEAQIRVAGKWIAIDPRAWRNQYDMTINVGLGTGNKDQEVQHLMAMIAAQQQAMMAGVVTPDNVFNAHSKLAQALGFKQDNLFFSDPTDPQTKGKMPPPPPNPEQMKGQVTMQVEQAKLQALREVEQFKAQLQAEVDKNAQAQQDAQNQRQMQYDMQKAQFEAQLNERAQEADRALKKYLGELQSQTSILIEQMRLGQKREQGAMDMQKHADSREDAAMMAQNESAEGDA